MRNAGLVIGILIVVLLCVLLGSASVAFNGMGMRGWAPGLGQPGFDGRLSAIRPIGYLLMACLWLVIIIGAVLFVLWLVRGPARPRIAGPAVESPMDILRARYARGEITKEQFEEMKKTLES
jgi:putative membrane protein